MQISVASHYSMVSILEIRDMVNSYNERLTGTGTGLLNSVILNDLE